MAGVLIPAVPVLAGKSGVYPTPFQFVFTGEDHLQITVYNVAPFAKLDLVGRFLADGDAKANVFTLEITPSTAGLPHTTVLPMGNGVLLNLGLRMRNVVVQPGQCYARVDVRRGLGVATVTVGTLIAGNLSSAFWRAWPGSVLEAPTEGRGYLHQVSGGAPAAGVSPSISVPDQARWRILSIDGVLVTNGVAGNRTPQLLFTQNTAIVGRFNSSLPQGPGATLSHDWGAGVAAGYGVATSSGQGSFPVDYFLSTHNLDVGTLTLACFNLDPGDQWTAVNLLVEEWRDPTQNEVT